MPINETEMKAMKSEYGAKKGTSIYYAKENKDTHGTMNPTSGGATKTTPMKKKGSAKAALRNTLSKMMGRVKDTDSDKK